MGFYCGIIGLPNSGKSTIFNALTALCVAAQPYPFCTIEPNIGVVTVPDPRLQQLHQVTRTPSVIPAAMEFVDIAGLVKGASQGEGLGNKFLSHIREVDAIVHVVRCFDNANVVHVDGSVDPLRDIEIVETEFPVRAREFLDRVPIAVAGREIHPAIYAAGIFAQRSFDQAHGLDKLAPVHRAQDTEAADAVAHRDLVRCLLLVLGLHQMVDRQTAL